MASRRPGAYYGLNPHIVPFLPYVEKSSDAALAGPWKRLSDRTDRIETATLKAWLTSCDVSHSWKCRVSEKKDDGRWPVWLVDVRKQCIVRAEAGMTYAALSYVWGRVECIALGAASVDKLTTERSLAGVRLPATIRDAITLAADLDLTYLWVDRLCIVQDDVAEKHSQLRAMADIYARAYVTFVAAEGGDASKRLSRRPLGGTTSVWSKSISLLAERVSGLLMPGTPSQQPVTAPSLWNGPETDSDVMQIMAINLLGGLWFSRGWTFQEYLFSSRKIVFQDNTVNWECRLASAHENQACLPEGTKACACQLPGGPATGSELDQWPNFHRYSRLVALFTLRSLTFPEDALDAFAGASAAISRIYPGGLVTGLPQMVFDAALIWQPYHPLTRRNAALISAEEAILPSWSWVSWYGNIQSESWASSYDYLRRQPGHPVDVPVSADKRWSTVSTVMWSHSETRTSARRIIEVGVDQWRLRYSDPEAALPDGWTRHAGGDGGGTDNSYYTYRMLPGHEFWYPILIQSDQSGQAARSRFLHCTTRHAHLRIPPKRHTSYGTACAVNLLEDPRSEFVGVLRVNGVNDTNAATAARTCHLIELSRGSVSLGADGEPLEQHPHASVFDEWQVPGWRQFRGQYEFYNVMEIDIRDGIASRLAVGRVEKSAWDRIATEQIDVVLG